MLRLDVHEDKSKDAYGEMHIIHLSACSFDDGEGWEKVSLVP